MEFPVFLFLAILVLIVTVSAATDDKIDIAACVNKNIDLSEKSPDHIKKSTSFPGRFSLALGAGRQGKAPWGRG